MHVLLGRLSDGGGAALGPCVASALVCSPIDGGHAGASCFCKTVQLGTARGSGSTSASICFGEQQDGEFVSSIEYSGRTTRQKSWVHDALWPRAAVAHDMRAGPCDEYAMGWERGCTAKAALPTPSLHAWFKFKLSISVPSKTKMCPTPAPRPPDGVIHHARTWGTNIPEGAEESQST